MHAVRCIYMYMYNVVWVSLSFSLSLSLSLSSLRHLVVANILPPTFSLAQSCLEQASGEGKVDVCLSTKSMGSASRHVGQRALSVL